MKSDFLRTKFAALAADGVERFPKISREGVVSQTHPKIMDEPKKSETKVSLEGSAIPELSQCTRGALKDTRKSVVFAVQPAPKKFLVLLEYPDESIESLQNTEFSFCESFFSWDETNTPLKNNGVVPVFDSSMETFKRLILKLGIADDCHISFAIKCVPRKGIPSDCAANCPRYNLQFEFQRVQPQVVLAFGHHAWTAWSSIAELPENKQRPIQAFCLPSPLELFANPSWRLGVWNRLVELKQGNS
jgi:hypothetical protein